MKLDIAGIEGDARLDTWNSRREMLVSLGGRDIPWIEMSPCQHPSDTHIAVTIAGVTIALDSEIAGVTPQITRFDGLPLWYVAWDTFVAGVDVETLTQVFNIDLRYPFYSLTRRRKSQLVAVSELGVVLFEPLGNEVWRYDADEIIAGFSVEANGISLILYDEHQILLDWDSGQVEQDRAEGRPL